MGDLVEVRGNLFDTTHGVIAHGVNCRGAFGAGLAAQIARRFPEVRRAYLRKHRGEGWHLGEAQYVLTAGGLVVVNMAIQDRYGRGGPHVDYHALQRALGHTLGFCQARGAGLALPRIGCGLAGGDWATVKRIIGESVEGWDVEVEVYSL
jgi:O-acetyl-ADP-ribose deacetylase (regulator of RNase III)